MRGTAPRAAIGNVLQQHTALEYTQSDATAAKIKGDFICVTNHSESNQSEFMWSVAMVCMIWTKVSCHTT